MEVGIGQQNKLIAEFIGAYNKNGWMIIPHRDYALSTRGYPNALKYHKEWGWIMPVIKQIRDLKSNDKWEHYEEAKMRYKAIENEMRNIDIRNTHYCVYKFIEWYNTVKF